jgi:hypothetical protein
MSFRLFYFVELAPIVGVMDNYFCSVRLNVNPRRTMTHNAFCNVRLKVVYGFNVPNLSVHKIISGRCPIYLLSLYATGLIDPLNF